MFAGEKKVTCRLVIYLADGKKVENNLILNNKNEQRVIIFALY